MKHRVYCPLMGERKLLHHWEDHLGDLEGSMMSGGQID
jgi:hypothetical protein